MRHVAAPFAIAACLGWGASLAACGGSSADLFGDEPGVASDGGALDATTLDADAASLADGAVAPEDAGFDAAGRGDDAATAPDARVPPVDAGPVSTDPGIFCGQKRDAGVYCPAGTSACCASSGNGGNAPRYRCTRSGAPCNGPSIECDDQADCNGAICCATLVDDQYDSVRCAATCTDGPRTTGVRMCDPRAVPDECAAIGLTCRPSTLLPGFHRCN